MNAPSSQVTKPLYFYVSGPYSPSAQEIGTAEGSNVVQANIDRAVAAALALVEKGHVPFVPHTMMSGWEGRFAVDRQVVMNLCRSWVSRCDALLFIGSSAGSEDERKTATALGLQVFESIEEVPSVQATDLPTLTSQAVTVYLEEYKQCAETYQHTYATIWQAGGLLFATAGVLIASQHVVVQTFGLTPLLFWYFGLFLPMDRYAELRSGRLRELEGVLSNGVPGVELAHFARYTKQREDNRSWIPGKWRVKRAVAIVGTVLVTLQTLLIVARFSVLLAALRHLLP